MTRIFISYRRSDSITISGRIYDRMLAAFGERNVFKDVDNIPLGADFRRILEQEVNQCDVLLVIIGRMWTDVRDEYGRRRLDDPNDFVRIEIESGLRRPNLVVVPVLVNGAAMPSPYSLPESMRDLVYRHAAVVREDPDFNRDIRRLIEQIQQVDLRRETMVGNVRQISSQTPPPAPSRAPAPAPAPAPAQPYVYAEADPRPATQAQVPSPRSGPQRGQGWVAVAIGLGVVLFLGLGAIFVGLLIVSFSGETRDPVPTSAVPTRDFGVTLGPTIETTQVVGVPTIIDLSTAAPTGGDGLLPSSLPGQIVFTANWDGNYDVYITEMRAASLRNVTQNSARNQEPVWSPDGARVAYVADIGGNRDVYLLEATTGQRQRITDHEALDTSPTWSPDGTQLAFLSRRDGNNEIYIYDLSSQTLRNLTNDPSADSDPDWSPDGSQIAFVSDRRGRAEVWTVNADGSNPVNLTRSHSGDAYNPDWSPDGAQIAFGSRRDGNFEVYVMNRDGSNVRRLTDSPLFDWYPAWSPDGQYIAYASGEQNGERDLWVMAADGSDKQRLTDGRARVGARTDPPRVTHIDWRE